MLEILLYHIIATHVLQLLFPSPSHHQYKPETGSEYLPENMVMSIKCLPLKMVGGGIKSERRYRGSITLLCTFLTIGIDWKLSKRR